METLIIHPQNKEQLSALKAVAKALKVDFETVQSSYNPEVVKKIRESEREIKEGKFITLDPGKSIWENLV